MATYALQLASAAFDLESGAGDLGDGIWTFTGSGTITASIPILERARMVGLRLNHDRGGAGTITVTTCKKIDNTKTVLDTTNITTGAGWTTTAITLGTPYDLEGGHQLYIRIECSATHSIGAAYVDFETTGLLDVKMFGAVGDGVSDDTAAIQNAVDAATASLDDLWFPAGTYRLTDTITVSAPDGLRMRSPNRGATLRYASATLKDALTFASTSKNVAIEGLRFLGDANDDRAVNRGSGIVLQDDCTELTIRDCAFEYGTPLTTLDSAKTRGLLWENNLCLNCTHGLHPPTDARIVNSSFIADTYVESRGQAIYSYGQQVNLSVQNCQFKNIAREAIQIRAGDARFQTRSSFRIEGCHFENCNTYAIWVGSDDKPDIGAGTVITGNTFKNCAGPVQAQGNRSAVITNNHIEYDWEYPFTVTNGNGIVVSGDASGGVHYQSARGCVVTGNKFIVHHPFFGKIKLTALPSDGQTVTVDAFTYRWKDVPTAELDVQIGANIATSADNLRAAIAGLAPLSTAPNPVLRYVTDAMCNRYGQSYGLTDFDTVVIASWRTYTMSSAADSMTLTQPIDLRIVCGYPVYVSGVISPLVANNVCDDTGNLYIGNCYAPSIYDNVLAAQMFSALVTGVGNVYSHYRGNRLNTIRRAVNVRRLYSIIDDGFAVIDDDHIVAQQYTYPEVGGGRSGIITVGDGKPYAFFYYGHEGFSVPDAASLPYRWNDGDQLILYLSGMTTFTFKRTSPGAGEFNSADSLIALINATGTFKAAYVDFVNGLGGTNPKKMMKIWIDTVGHVDPASVLINVRRYKKPGDTTTYKNVPPPLLNGTVLRNTETDANLEDGSFYGGSSTKTKTFVHTPLANKNRPVLVQGIDATSQALSPIVYQADVVAGVGFTITHGAASGTEKFAWRVG